MAGMTKEEKRLKALGAALRTKLQVRDELPQELPYLGMGSSYFAALAFRYMGLSIYPELASEYFYYLQGARFSEAVILSQSGKSSEALWCADLFQQYTAITNDPESPLATHPSASRVIRLQAGEEKFSSSKTYVNTLLALFKGFGFRMEGSVDALFRRIKAMEEKGKALADEVFSIVSSRPVSGLYITGSGPDIATALQSALILSESSRLCFQGLALAQYDHGPKETAKDSIVIQVVSRGPAYTRNGELRKTITNAGASVLVVEEEGTDNLSPVLFNCIPFNFMAYYLSRQLGIAETFVVGNKVTEVRSL